jgi:integrase
MPRVDIPRGVHPVRKQLASGVTITYYYAWRGGPRIAGEPGSDEFYTSYGAHLAGRTRPNPERFHSIVAGFRRSPEFLRLAPRTRADYTKHLTAIETKFGDLPLAALEDMRITKDFLDWRDTKANSARQADYAWTVLMRLIAWARMRGLTTYRPPQRIEHLYHADRSEKIWLAADVAAFMAKASIELQRAMVLALDTGQRQGDLLRLAWGAYDGKWIRLRQGKTGRRVGIPATRDLMAILNSMPRRGTVILTSARGRPWTANGFRSAWRKAAKAAGIVGLTFHDLRGTTVTRLAENEASNAQIASITGHSLRDVGAILDKYLAPTEGLALAAIAKLERTRA